MEQWEKLHTGCMLLIVPLGMEMRHKLTQNAAFLFWVDYQMNYDILEKFITVISFQN